MRQEIRDELAHAYRDLIADAIEARSQGTKRAREAFERAGRDRVRLALFNAALRIRGQHPDHLDPDDDDWTVEDAIARLRQKLEERGSLEVAAAAEPVDTQEWVEVYYEPDAWSEVDRDA